MEFESLELLSKICVHWHMCLYVEKVHIFYQIFKGFHSSQCLRTTEKESEQDCVLK